MPRVSTGWSWRRAPRAAGRYHGVAEEGVPFRDIAGVIGRRLGVPVVSKTTQEAGGHFGWFAALDNPSSSAWTKEKLGWRLVEPALLPDLDRPGYFST
jgi:hypothetical protein